MAARATSPIPPTVTKIVVLLLLGERSAAPRVTGGTLVEVVASGGSAELSTSTGSSTAATLMMPSEGIALISVGDLSPLPPHRGRHAGQLGHVGDARRADQAAVVVQVGLHDVDSAVGDHPAEAPFAVLLFAA